MLELEDPLSVFANQAASTSLVSAPASARAGNSLPGQIGDCSVDMSAEQCDTDSDDVDPVVAQLRPSHPLRRPSWEAWRCRDHPGKVRVNR